MKIDEVLKNNLIADVENICDITLDVGFKTSLKRAFEITIGHHFNLQPVTDKEATTEQEKSMEQKPSNVAKTETDTGKLVDMPDLEQEKPQTAEMPDETKLLIDALSKKSRRDYDAMILNSPKESPATQKHIPDDEEIKEWANNKYGCSGTQAIACKREVNIAIDGAKWLKEQIK